MRKEKAGNELTTWLNTICYENGILVDDCAPVLCKACGEGAWLIKDIEHKKGCDVAKAEKNLTILKSLPAEGKEEVCEWVKDDDGCYDTQCGNKFYFDCGDVKDNGAVFCQYCGKPIKEVV